jgi:P-type Cu+ transporter
MLRQALITMTDLSAPQRPQDSATPDSPRHIAELEIGGMSCASCASRVEKALAKVPGVVRASVNLATERATVGTASPVDAETLAAAVRHAGYDAQVIAPPPCPPNPHPTTPPNSRSAG